MCPSIVQPPAGRIPAILELCRSVVFFFGWWKMVWWKTLRCALGELSTKLLFKLPRPRVHWLQMVCRWPSLRRHDVKIAVSCGQLFVKICLLRILALSCFGKGWNQETPSAPLDAISISAPQHAFCIGRRALLQSSGLTVKECACWPFCVFDEKRTIRFSRNSQRGLNRWFLELLDVARMWCLAGAKHFSSLLAPPYSE